MHGMHSRGSRDLDAARRVEHPDIMMRLNVLLVLGVAACTGAPAEPPPEPDALHTSPCEGAWEEYREFAAALDDVTGKDSAVDRDRFETFCNTLPQAARACLQTEYALSHVEQCKLAMKPLSKRDARAIGRALYSRPSSDPEVDGD